MKYPRKVTGLSVPALSRDGSLGSSPDCDGRRISPPSKLDKLRLAGFSAEFLDRVSEPNGNIPDKYSLGKMQSRPSYIDIEMESTWDISLSVRWSLNRDKTPNNIHLP